MWVTKLLISPVKKRIFCPKTTKFGPKLAFLVNLGQAMRAYSVPCWWVDGGCGARAVSRKTHIYFIVVYCLKYYLHLKEKVVEKGETNREKLEWIRSQDVLLYFHLIGTIARCSFIFSHYCRDCKMLDPFTFSLSGKLRRSTAS